MRSAPSTGLGELRCGLQKTRAQSGRRPLPLLPASGPTCFLPQQVFCCPHRLRRSAEKFGTEYVDPSQRRDMRLDARKERFNRPGFATGIVSCR